MQNNNNNQPDTTGNNRDDKGKFITGVSGNPAGRPKGSLSITSHIKQKLSQIPEGENRTYLELLIDQIIDKAIKGDYQFVKQIWEHIDGKIKEIKDEEEEKRIVRITINAPEVDKQN